MINPIHRPLTLAATLILCISAASALELGDPAPQLQVDAWLKAGPVKITSGHVYVIEFWATGCKHCLRGIPNLTALQRQYRDQNVHVVAISSSDPSRQVLQEYLHQIGDLIDYAVAYEDNDQRPTRKAYMDALKLRSIPHAFIVDGRGRLVWEGHPHFGLQPALAALLAGTTDVAELKRIGDGARERKLRQRRATRALVDRYLKLSAESYQPPEVATLAEQILSDAGSDDPTALNSVAWATLSQSDLKYRDLRFALRAAKAAHDACGGADPEIVHTYAYALFYNGMIDEALEQEHRARSRTGSRNSLRQMIDDTIARMEKTRRQRN